MRWDGDSEKKATCHSHYVWQTKKNVCLALENALKKYASCYYQLKVRYKTVNMFMIKIKVIGTSKHRYCRVAKQTIKHLYTWCQKLRNQKRTLIHK